MENAMYTPEEKSEKKTAWNPDPKVDLKAEQKADQKTDQNTGRKPKKDVMQNITGQTVFLCVLVLVLMIPVLASLVLFGTCSILDGLRKYNIRELNALSNLLESTSEYKNVAKGYLSDNLERNVLLTTEALRKDFLDQDVYLGPRVLEDGMVLEIRNGQLEYPEGMAGTFPDLTAVSIRKMALSDNVILIGNDTIEFFKTRFVNHQTKEEKDVYVTVGLIADDLYYVDWTEEEEVSDFIKAYVDDEELLKTAEHAYGGNLALIDLSEKDYPLLYVPSAHPGALTSDDLGITQDELKQEVFVNFSGFETSMCSTQIISEGREALVLMDPISGSVLLVMLRSGLVTILMVLVLYAIIIYQKQVHRFVKERILSEDQQEKYCPSNVRRTGFAIALLGGLLVFLSAALVQSLGVLRSQESRQTQMLDLLFVNMEHSQEETKADTLKEFEEWYVYYGNRMAELISKNPELRTPENLQRFSDILDTDYIMLFDETGAETISSNDYTGFRLGSSYWPEGLPFQKLLTGVPYVISEEDYVAVPEKRLKLIGVPMPVEEEGKNHGALIMALNPDSSKTNDEISEINEQLSLLMPESNICFVVDINDHSIRYSSDPSLLGWTTEDLGIPETKIRNGLMDFLTINYKRYFTISTRQNDSLYYNADGSGNMFSSVLPYSLLALIFHALLSTLFLYLSRRGYTDEVFRKYAVIGRSVVVGGIIEVTGKDGEKRRVKDPGSRWALDYASWRDLLPGEKTRSIIKLIAGIAIIYYELSLDRAVAHTGEKGMVQFIMSDSWTRGFNLFAVFGILIVTASAFLAVFTIKIVLMIISRYTSTKGETVCRLIYNMVEYAGVMVTLYYSLGFVGVDSRTILTSLGLVSLALSFGAQKLIADIIAGISIVFEGDFQVGDVVDIGGYRGVVQEIGVRSTKIIGQGDNIKIINNSEIKNVINMTQLNSWYPLNISVDVSEPLDRIEEFLNRELPLIGEKNPLIKSGPYYAGVTELSGGKMTLCILTEYSEKDYRKVQRYVHREIRSIFDKEGIKIK